MAGMIADSRFSVIFIPFFEYLYSVNTDLFERPKSKYLTLNQWFRRDIKPQLLNKPLSPSDFCSPCESYLQIHEELRHDSVVQSKGKSYSLDELIGEPIPDSYAEGTLLVFRLSPGHYHNFHYVNNGRIIDFKSIKGAYFPVNYIGLNFIENLFSENRRDVTLIDSESFGQIYYIEIGALNVGSIVQYNSVGDRVCEGDKKGYFQFGGSTVMILLEKEKLLLEKGFRGNDTNEKYVFVGDILGHKI